MAHYIDKDALVAEIERRKNICEKITLDLRNQENKDYYQGKAEAYKEALDFLNTLEVKEVPIWEKVSPDTGQTTLYKDGDKSYLERFGYRIDLKDLDKLPKKKSTHRTPADIEVAMQEVEAKSEAYTNAHRGERDDDVLSQMRGEYVSDDLEKAAERDVCGVVNNCSAIGMPNDHIPSWVQDAMINEFIHGSQWKEEQFEKNRIKHCNSISNEQAELEQKFLDEHLDKYDRMPTFLDAIEYGMRLQKEQMMEQAVGWLKLFLSNSVCIKDVGERAKRVIVDDFRKAMKG